MKGNETNNFDTSLELSKVMSSEYTILKNSVSAPVLQLFYSMQLTRLRPLVLANSY